jgi:ketosteroid isomerase-like protein
VGSENVEIVRRLYELFRARDNEAAFELFDSEIEWDARGGGIPGLDAVYVGREGVTTFWRAWLEAWDEIDFDVSEPVEVEEGRVVARITRQRNRGRGTGIWVDQRPYEQEWALRGGKVVRMTIRWIEPY